MKWSQVVAVAALIMVAAAIIWLFATAPRPSEPDLRGVASSASAESAPGPATATPPPADPCHDGGVTFCALNPEVTEATIDATICVTGWTASIRPPESYTEALKLQQMRAEGLGGPAGGYEEDHRMPLELGGAPRDATNLSPEPHSSSYAKDAAENVARREVCDGEDLRSVQAAFVAAWLGPYPAYRR